MSTNNNLLRDLKAAYKNKMQCERLYLHRKLDSDLRNWKLACDRYEVMQAINKEVMEGGTIQFVPNAAKSKWDNIETEAITMGGKIINGKPDLWCERTDDPREIYFYSVYLHQVNGGVKCVADVPTYKAAIALEALLRHAILNYKDNGYLTPKPKPSNKLLKRQV